MKVKEDKYTNVLTAQCTGVMSNVPAFAEVNIGTSLGIGRGILIDHIDYWPTAEGIALMTTNQDWIRMGWSTRTQDHLDIMSSSTIDALQITRADFGSAASGLLYEMPMRTWYAPPIILASPKIYLAYESDGLADILTITSRLFFRYVDLTTQEYLEIAETFILTG